MAMLFFHPFAHLLSSMFGSQTNTNTAAAFLLANSYAGLAKSRILGAPPAFQNPLSHNQYIIVRWWDAGRPTDIPGIHSSRL